MPRRDMFSFKFSDEWYTVQGAETALHGDKSNLKAMKDEYTRMRDVAEKRLKRLEEKFSESKAYSQHKEGFSKISEIDPRDLPKAFSDVARFLRAKTSTVSGQKSAQRKTMNTLNNAIGAKSGGQQAVTKENYWRVIKILEEARKRNISYGSDKVVTLAETTLELSNDQFDDVLKNLEKLREHVDELKDTMDEYLEDNDIEEYQIVDIDDFIEKLGW